MLGAVAITGLTALLWYRQSARRARRRTLAHGDHHEDHHQQATAGERNAPELQEPSQGPDQEAPVVWPRNGRQRQAFMAHLDGLYQGPGGSRLRAIGLARQWGHPSVLPLLRRGLGDVNPAVMREAALAMDVFRCRSSQGEAGWGVARPQGPAGAQSPAGAPLATAPDQTVRRGFVIGQRGFLPRDQPVSAPRTVARIR